MTYNIMTCSGFGTSFLGGCSMAWLSFAIVLFIALIARRQCSDGILAGTGFNLIGALVFGLGTNVFITTISGSARWALLGGIIGVIVGGYVLGMFFDQAGGEEDYG